MMDLQHWQVETDKDQIAWWRLDRKGVAVNTLNSEVFQELAWLIENARQHPSLKGIVIASAKSTGFIAGADIHQFVHIHSESEALAFIRQGQQVFNQLAALNIPTLAVIAGFCMGGGTELALACRYRLAEENPRTQIGLPEVKLGLRPGWGGTIRLILLIGVLKAMRMILSGKAVDARTAAKLGVVDAVVPERHLVQAAKAFLLNPPVRSRLNIFQKMLNWPLSRFWIAQYLRRNLTKYVCKDHYPAPYAIIEGWEKDGCLSPDAMENEAKSLARLAVSPAAQNLIRVFFLQEKLKSLTKHLSFKAQHVHIVGAGTMGGDIAALCVARGLKVTLQDNNPQSIGLAVKRAYEYFQHILKEPRLMQAAMDRLIPDSEGHGIQRGDIILEAITESLSAKQKVFEMLEEKAKADAILATNTSSLILSAIGEKMKNPHRLVGIHFFNPATKMLLVEVVRDEQTDQQMVNHALAFVRQLDKLPLPVKSAPGFLINRILLPYLKEAMQLVQEGWAPEIIDEAAMRFGMPMGPVELADTIGLDVCLSVASHILSDTESFNLLEDKIKHHQLGCKTGKGFYYYKNGKAQKNENRNITSSIENAHRNFIIERLISSMITEAEKCLAEKIVENSDLLDAGMIFGTGFAPFRGGLLHYASSTKSLGD